MLIGENSLGNENGTKYELKVGPVIDQTIKDKLYDTFKDYYIKPVRPDDPKVDFEMTKRIKPNNEPFYFCPRKLSCYEKTQVDKMVNELINNKIIQKVVLRRVYQLY